MIRAKSRLTEQKNSAGWGDGKPAILASLLFVPVGDDTEENKKFWDATPSGRIEMDVLNPEAIEGFEVMKEYYVDFTEVPEQPLSSTQS